MADEVDYTRDLGRFCGPDEGVARCALDRLAAPARRFIRAIVAKSVSPDDVEEVAQTALLKAWMSRLSFVNQGQAAWYGWLKRIARNACVDLFRARGEEAGEPIPEDIQDDELPLIERFMTEIMGKELFALADTVWLEDNAETSSEHSDRSLIAVQLLYFDEWSLDDVLSLLSDVRPDTAPLTRRHIDSWLSLPSNLRRVIYHELLYPPERLAAHLLGLQPHEGVRELESALVLTHSMACPDGVYRDWTAREAEAILWRYYRGVSVEETVHQIKDATLAALDAVFVRCSLLFPFRSRCEFLCEWLENVDVNGFGRDTILGRQSGVWRRLAFEYRYRYSLPVRDIHDRIQPASEVVRYGISFGMLNTWLSGGRLLDKLRESYEARQVNESHG